MSFANIFNIPFIKNMGAGASANPEPPPFESVKDAIAAGKTDGACFQFFYLFLVSSSSSCLVWWGGGLVCA